MSEEAMEAESADAEAQEVVAANDTEVADWKTSIPEDIRDNPNFSKYTSMESFAKGHLNAISMLGKQPELKVPENDDERNEFYNKLGRPDEQSGYEFKSFEVDEMMQDYVNGRVDSYKELSHSIGLSNAQAAAVHEWYMEGNAENAKTATEMSAATEKAGFDALKNEWGDAYDRHLNAAQNALAEFGGDELKTYLDQTGLGNNPDLIKAFFNIGKGMMGDTFLEEGDTGKTPGALDGEIKEIMAMNAYWEADSPERPALVRKVSELMKQMHPEAQA